MKKTTTKATPKAEQLRLVRNLVRELNPQDLAEVGGANYPGGGCSGTCRDKYSFYVP